MRSGPPEPADEMRGSDGPGRRPPYEGERKQVTVLFADLDDGTTVSFLVEETETHCPRQGSRLGPAGTP